MGEAPVLTTARLRLRSHRESDLGAQAAVLADPEVVRHLGGQPFSREDSWRRMLCSPGLWVMLGYGYWLVERRDDGAYLGQIGFADFKRDMSPSIEGLPEMGWIFAPHAQGQGYASEAAAAALGWADAHLPAAETVAIISHANAASIRVAEKAGFAERSEASYRDEPILLFRRPRAARR
ncbi:MAG TPA: GNAT family N-acetyltransferase [Allosphingosinicella sp.]|nr:GNAT family N-acetyltransferase [Allosphingosinicella sp.]